MIESAEGIGSRKWSFLPGEHGLDLMEGTKRLATLTDEGKKVLHLLVTAPQLWEAANEVIKSEYESIDGVNRLMNAVAKSVGKDDWKKVLQS